MQLLEYYNIMLTAAQQECISDTETQDYEVSQLKAVLDQAKKEIFARHKFRFNSHFQTFSPTNGVVTIPSTVIRFDLPSSLDGRVVERQKGEPLWDIVNNEAWAQDVTCRVWDDVDYPKIPEVFAQWIAWRAAELFSFKLNGANDPNLVYIRSEVAKARQRALNSERKYIDNTFGFGDIGAAFNQGQY